MRRWISAVCICALIPLAGITATAAPEYGVGRIEAEAMQLDEGYYTAQSEYASGGTYIKMTDRAQRDSVWCGAEFTFSGGTGVYNLDIVYPDYYSGSSTRKLYINGEQLRIWSGKITYGASVWGSRPVFEPEVIRTKTVQEVLLQQGDIIRIESKTDYGEYGELDYVEIYQGEREEEETTGVTFTDIEGLEEEEAIKALAAAGIIRGDGGAAFGPEETASLDMALAMLVRLMGYTDIEGTEGDWAQGIREKAQAKGWVSEAEVAAGAEAVTGDMLGSIYSRVLEMQEAGTELPRGTEALKRRELAAYIYKAKERLDTLLPETEGTPSYPLDELGYIKNWLYTGMVATDVYEGGDSNAGLAEAQNRPLTFTVPENTQFSAELANGMEFRPSPMGKTGMLNEVTRGGDPDLMYVEGYLCADLIVEEDMQVNAKLQMARGYNEVYLNGSRVASLLYNWTRNTSVSFVLNLKAGRNRIFVRLNGLQGNIITTTAGVQLLDHTEEVRVAPPALEAECREVFGAEEWSFEMKLEDGKLTAETAPPAGASLLVGNRTYTWPKYSRYFDFAEEMGGEKPIDVIVRAKAGENEISRTLKLVQNAELQRTDFETLEEHQQNYRRTLIEEGGQDWDYIQLMLLKLSENMELTTEDNDKIMDALISMDMLSDCAEFTMTHALRLFLLYPDKVEQRVRDKLKESILNFGYWSDEEGTESMVMSSENHKIGLYTCQYLAGKLYPDEIFTRSGRTGRQQEEIARGRLEGWLNEVETYGFEEYNSSAYVDVTFNSLLNLYDFAEDEQLTARAKTLLDLIMYIAASTTFDGISMGVEGRVYAETLYFPATSMKNGLLSYLSLQCNVAEYTQQVMGLATSSYRGPSDLEEWISKDLDLTFQQGGATLSIRRRKDYIISGTEVPTQAEGTLAAQFVPGNLLYQYHLWEASLSADTKAFVTHPGAASENSTQRPGYWYGEQVAPTARMEGGTVMEIYDLPADTGTPFTHLYFTTDTFEEVRQEGQWLFGRHGEGYIGIWCSRELEPYSDLTLGREYRANGLKTAWVCQVSSAEESGSFDAFIDAFRSRMPEFDEQEGKLLLDNEVALETKLPLDTAEDGYATVYTERFDSKPTDLTEAAGETTHYARWHNGTVAVYNTNTEVHADTAQLSLPQPYKQDTLRLAMTVVGNGAEHDGSDHGRKSCAVSA